MRVQAITPGYGFCDLHLGMSAAELIERYGTPVRLRKATSLREYWVYDHFNFIMSRKTHRMLSLFVNARFTAALGEDVEAWTEQSIRNKMGAPELEGGDVALSENEYLDRWITFASGIGFRFDREGRVKMVMIFRKRRAAARKPVATSHVLAAAA